MTKQIQNPNVKCQINDKVQSPNYFFFLKIAENIKTNS